jgi:hypothetical protein
VIWPAALFLLCSCADDRGPRLESVMPASAPAGAIVSLAGEGLCGDDGDCDKAAGSIRIGLDNPVQANVVELFATSAMIRIPSIAPVGKTELVATVNEHASNALAFEVLPPP